MRYLAHELRNPLNSMFMGIELLKTEVAADSAVVSQLLDDITVSSYKAIEVLDTLSVEQIDTDVMELEKSVIPVSALVTEAIQHFTAKVKYPYVLSTANASITIFRNLLLGIMSCTG